MQDNQDNKRKLDTARDDRQAYKHARTNTSSSDNGTLFDSVLHAVGPHILEYVTEVNDIISIDCTCSYLKKMNENIGWKSFAINTFAFPASYRNAAGDDLSWRSFLLTRVVPIYVRLIRGCKVEEEKGARRDTEKCRKMLLKHDWPLDAGIFLACLCYLSLYWLRYFCYTDGGDDSTPSFAHWGTFWLGGGDTKWWTFVVLKGTVHVPLAPPNYARNNQRGDPVEIGRGGIVAFSHWNHGGAATTAKHIHPKWQPEQFGFEKCAFENVCDEWVRVNLEEPVQASFDSPPAAWKDVFSFLSELETSSAGF